MRARRHFSCCGSTWYKFVANVPLPANLSGLSRAELESLLVELFGKVAALEKTASEQREEIARLKGLKGRPAIKPSGMDKGTEPAKPGNGKRRFRGQRLEDPEDAVMKLWWDARPVIANPKFYPSVQSSHGDGYAAV